MEQRELERLSQLWVTLAARVSRLEAKQRRVESEIVELNTEIRNIAWRLAELAVGELELVKGGGE